MPSQPLPAGTGTSPLTKEEQQAAGPQAAGVHGPRSPRSRGRKRAGGGKSGAAMWNRAAARTFMCPRRGGAAAVIPGPPGEGQRPGSASALPAWPPPACGPPPALPAGDAPTAVGGVPGYIRCLSLQQVALQILPGAVKSPEPPEQSSPGTDARDFPGLWMPMAQPRDRCLCMLSKHPCAVQWHEALRTRSQLPR